MTNFNQTYLFLFFFLCTFHFPELISSRAPPKEISSLGGHNKQIIHISLQQFPPAAFARIAVGDPPVRKWLDIDTGSDLTWVLHNPRYGYDPLRSSTFTYRSCDGLFKSHYVTPSKTRGQCTYRQEFADKAVYEGTLGTETFTFQSGDGELGMLKNVLFGFGKTVTGMKVGMGTLGLNMGVLSITNLIGRKFSICIGNFNYISREKHFLALGDDAVFGGWEVPLDTKENAYKVSLSSITIEGESLGLENVLSKTKSILDTGTSTISLVQEVYHVVVGKIKKIMSDAGYEESDLFVEHKMICYEGEVPEHKKLQVSLKFGKVTLDMETTTLFVNVDTTIIDEEIDEDIFCLSVYESPLKENLIGIPMFQGHNIGFDIPNNKLYIQPVECHKLDDSFNDELGYRNP